MITKEAFDKVTSKLQKICPHNFGRIDNTCSYCCWDMTKCQHKKADRLDSFCRECGEKL
ncbi:MAG: hypothetical protein [Bacteriophage sp.]|nr:MAG: hypothetical protein [Bacteriophage sp.]